VANVFSQLRTAIVAVIVLTVLTGVIYPLAVTGIAQLLFPKQANGSLIEEDGKLVGSKLIGQAFDDPKYFWGRPSATGSTPYDGTASGGSNLGPTNEDLVKNVAKRIEELKKADPNNDKPVPIDLVTASGSGLDPHISPAAAEYQVERVARERKLDADQVRKLIAEHTEERTFGLLGEPRVNVLELNRGLDKLK
jgi:potassium-transporting ATPase KdpC subunit